MTLQHTCNVFQEAWKKTSFSSEVLQHEGAAEDKRRDQKTTDKMRDDRGTGEMASMLVIPTHKIVLY